MLFWMVKTQCGFPPANIFPMLQLLPLLCYAFLDGQDQMRFPWIVVGWSKCAFQCCISVILDEKPHEEQDLLLTNCILFGKSETCFSISGLTFVTVLHHLTAVPHETICVAAVHPVIASTQPRLLLHRIQPRNQYQCLCKFVQG